MRTLTFFLCLLFSTLQAQNFTITQYNLGASLNDAQLMQFTETTDGQVYFLYFYFDSGVRKHRMQVFDGSSWASITRPCERCINHLYGGNDGQLYAATDDNILHYNPTDDSWSTYLAESAAQLAINPSGTMTFINTDGAFDYDGTTVSPRNNANAPSFSFSSNVRAAVFEPNGDLYAIISSQVYRQDSDGWSALTDVTSPSHLALAPDGKVYVTDNFGGIHYYQNKVFTNTAITGIFPSFFGLTGFAINEDGVFWGATQGGSSSLIRYEPSTPAESIPLDDLIPESILISKVFVASNNLVFVVSDFRTYVTTVDDDTATNIFQLEVPVLDFAVSPNPSNGFMQLKWNQLPTGLGSISILNAMGQTCYQTSIAVKEGHGQLDIVTSALPNGNYWLVFRIGTYFGRQQLVVNNAE